MSVLVRCSSCGTVLSCRDFVPLADQQTFTCPVCKTTAVYDLRFSRFIGKADLASNIAPQYSREAGH